MQASEDQLDATGESGVEPKPRLQFGIGWLFRITALLAVFFAVVGWAYRRWPEDFGGVVASMVLVFWPTIVVLCVWNWPWIDSVKRKPAAWSMGLAGLACLWIYSWETGELAWAYMLTVLASLCVWFPQLVLIAAILNSVEPPPRDEFDDT